MELSFSERNLAIDYKTQHLLKRMLNPLTGMNRSIGFMNRSKYEPRMMTAGGDLTGIHVLRNRPDPGPGSYHIGGSGIFLNEPIIRCLGESLERYSQLISDVGGKRPVEVATYKEMIAMGRVVISSEKLKFFTDQQYRKDKFPFRPFDSQMPMGWIEVPSLTGGPPRWLPAQLFFVGYSGRKGEKRLNASVTTGTAAHTSPVSAQFNALKELIQIDSVMGHWYSSAVAPRIEMDARTKPMTQLLDQYFSSKEGRPQFYFLKNADLPAFSIACVIRKPGRIPSIGVGLGIGVRLNRALYSALLEASGVIQMAKKAIIDKVEKDNPGSLDFNIDPENIYDLDSNVVYYASPGNEKYVDEKFSEKMTIPAKELPPDLITDPEGEVEHLLNGFRNTGKELYCMDLTTRDLEQLGFCSCRAWSPDTLSLSLPSAPPVLHPRFSSYGGASNPMPHPYP